MALSCKPWTAFETESDTQFAIETATKIETETKTHSSEKNSNFNWSGVGPDPDRAVEPGRSLLQPQPIEMIFV